MKAAPSLKLFLSALLLPIVVLRGQAQGPTLTVLHTFSAQSGMFGTNSDGANPESGLLLSGNILYGTTFDGGTGGGGSIFRANTDGSSFTNLHSFSGPPQDGGNSYASLIVSGNRLFGASYTGGNATGPGTVFAIDITGDNYTNLYRFTPLAESARTNGDGAYPAAALVSSGGALYGTASSGGPFGRGTVFTLGVDGSGFKVLHAFTAISFPDHTNEDGVAPEGPLVLSGDTLYGTAAGAGVFGNGTIFAINTNGSGFTVLHAFGNPGSPGANAEGSNPYSGLLLSGNALFGTTYYGGTYGQGTIFRMNTDGSGFTNLHGFSGGDGASPWGLSIVGNTLFGSTQFGGNSWDGTAYSGNGSVFSVSTMGTDFATLYFFTASSGSPAVNGDGQNPKGSVIASGGALYGTTAFGGGTGFGTVFSLSLPATRPTLAVQAAGNQVVVSWPLSAMNYVLQTATNLPSDSWNTISAGIGIVGANHVYTNNVPADVLFFRLQSH